MKNKIDIEKLLAKASTISIKNYEILDTDKAVLDFFKVVYAQYGDTWVMQTQIVTRFKEFSTIKMKLEKLTIKNMLESRLFGTRKVYRLKVTKNE